LNHDGYFKGYASVFNNLDNHNDIILPNAFLGVEAKEVKFLWQHDVNQPIGKITKLYQDKVGLVVEGKLSLNSDKGREVYGLLKDGAVEGLSIGFEVKDSFCKGEYRYLTSIKLWEVSVVTFPANSEAKVIEVKAMSSLLLAWEDFLTRY
ncbi:MAG: HK97 family phage prohead protease, partial [Rickettsiales bacterium]